MEYTIITDSGEHELSVEVNKYIAMGWKPVGGIACNSETQLLYQAMVKD